MNIFTKFRLMGTIGALLLAGCTRNSGNNKSNGDSETDTSDTTAASSDSDTEQCDLFDEGKLLEIRLSLPADEWETLKQNAVDEAYTPADVVIDGEAVSNVGLRFKGGWGTLVYCFDDTGALICPKLSLKIKFSEYDKEQRFKGLNRLNLHSMVRDSALMREYLGYKAFRDAGILTSRVSYAEVFVNDEPQGLYAVVEQMDGRFTDDRFPQNGNGDLYKEVWPQYQETAPYENYLKTNKDSATHAGMVNLATILGAAPDSERAGIIGNYVDVDYMMNYLAVNEAMNNWDGIGIWYCDDDGYCSPHNFYFYQEENREFFWLFPWDLDSTFILNAWNGHPPRWNDLTANCDEPLLLPEGGFHVQPPSCDPLLRALALQDSQRYVDAINNVLNTVFDEARLLAQIDNLVALLSDSVDRDPVWDLNGWLGAVDALRRNIPLLRGRLIQIRDGEDVSPFHLNLDGINDLEAVSQMRLLAGSVAMNNPQSESRLTVNSVNPLAGTQDIRLDFTLRNEGDAMYSSWASGDLSLNTLADFTNLSAVRLTFQTDTARTVQLGLMSPLSTTLEQGGIYGWNINATGEVQQLELPIADIDYPWWWTDTGNMDDLATILTQINYFRLVPFPATVGTDGMLPAPEPGFVTVDNIEFVFAK